MAAAQATSESQSYPPQQESNQVANQRPLKRIFVGNLPLNITKDELNDLCSKYGRVINVEVSRKGFGFVTFLNPQDADFAIYQLTEKLFRNNILYADWSQPPNKEKAQPQQGKTYQKKEAPKKVKKQGQSLMYLTPRNPPTASPTTNAAPPKQSAWDKQPDNEPPRDNESQSQEQSFSGWANNNQNQNQNQSDNDYADNNDAPTGGDWPTGGGSNWSTGSGNDGSSGGGNQESGWNAPTEDNRGGGGGKRYDQNRGGRDDQNRGGRDDQNRGDQNRGDQNRGGRGDRGRGGRGDRGDRGGRGRGRNNNGGRNDNSYNNRGGGGFQDDWGNQKQVPPPQTKTGKGKKGKDRIDFEVTVRNLNTNQITYTLQMTEAEVKKHIHPLVQQDTTV